MKKNLLIALVLVVACAKAQLPPLSFTITNNSGSNALTCAHPTINLSATSNYTGSVSYTWVSPTQTLSGSNVNINSAGNYTVMALGSNSAVATQTLGITVNTIAPTSAVSPLSQNITCSLSSAVAFTGTASGANTTQYFLSPYGGSVIAGTSPATYQPHAPGTYTHIAMDNVNGCIVTKTFTITSTSGLPTYSIASPQNFTLGCTTKSVATINIINASTQPTSGGPVSYTILSPFSGPTIPGPNSAFTINIPGTYTAVVMDNTNLCETRTPFSVVSNTFAPNASVNVPSQILDCNITHVKLQASSTTPNVSFAWTFPGTPGTVIGDSIGVNVNLALPTLTLLANFTLTTVDNNNTCKSTTIVPMFQNLFPPKAMINSGGQGAISCSIPTVMLTNNSISGIPLGVYPSIQPVVAMLWVGPVPQTPTVMSTTYLASTPGVYTMTAKDLNNGCISTTVITIGDNRIFPVLNSPTAPPPACLISGTATLSPVVTGGSSFTFTWSAPSAAVVSGGNTPVLTTNMLGTYTVAVTNSQGCTSSASMDVIDCAVGVAKNTIGAHSISVFPNPGNGSFFIQVEGIAGNVQLNVFNSLGMLVKKQEIIAGKNAINLTSEANGVYILQISDGNALNTSKFIKE